MPEKRSERGAKGAGQDAMSELDFEAFCTIIGQLPEESRKAFVLRKIYQYSDEEIAQHCGVSVDAVKSDIQRGFGLLKANDSPAD